MSGTCFSAKLPERICIKKGVFEIAFFCARSSPLCAPYILLQSLQTYGVHSTKFHRFPSEAAQELGGRGPTSPP